MFNSIASKSIPNGTKFIAIFGDGSGCDLFSISQSGHLSNAYEYLDDAAPDQHLMDVGYAYWVELPKTFKFWKDMRHE